MAHRVLMTGASGMFGAALLDELVRDPAVDRVFALVHATPLRPRDPRITELQGDVRRPSLGLDATALREVTRDITAVVHAAADTRFNAPLDELRATNVEGVRHVLGVAEQCTRLERVSAFSTVYVAGRREGRILEEDLFDPPGFVNAYERSKHESERLLRQAMARLPVSVVRLSTIVGRAADGTVARLRAIHHAIRFYYHSLAPMVPGTPASPVDLIALEYAAEAAARLLLDRFQPGRTWHVAAGDTAPGLDRLLTLTLDAFLEARPRWRTRAIPKPAIVPLATFELFARSVQELGVTALAGAVAALDTFAPQLAHPKTFDDARCRQALEGSGVVRPDLAGYYPRIVRGLIAPASDTCLSEAVSA